MRLVMRRREFITLIGAAASWPTAARAQQTALPAIGYLHPGTEDSTGLIGASAFREGWSQSGFVEGRDVSIEYRFAETSLSGCLRSLPR